MPHYRSDPRWIVAKYPGKDRNGVPFTRGDRVFYYPLTRTILAGEAAERAAADFEVVRLDEDFG